MTSWPRRDCACRVSRVRRRPGPSVARANEQCASPGKEADRDWPRDTSQLDMECRCANVRRRNP
jgi:hypothetical protein